MRRRLTLAVAITLSIGCRSNRSGFAPAPRRAPARDSLLSADASRGDSLAAHGAVDGMLTWLASDAVYLRGGYPAVYGRPAIQTLLRVAPLSGTGTPSWQPLGGAISADQRAGYTFGVAARPTPGAAQAVRFERYIAFWQRTTGASWKIVAYVEIGAGPAGGADVVDGISPPSQPNGPGVARTCSELAQADSAFADRSRLAGTPAAFAAVMASDGITFAGAELIVGPRAERDFLESQRTSLIWHPVYVGAAGSGDLGFTVGLYVSTGRGSSGAAVQQFGKYLTIWRRDEHGAWKVAADGGNAMPNPGGTSRPGGGPSR